MRVWVCTHHTKQRRIFCVWSFPNFRGHAICPVRFVWRLAWVAVVCESEFYNNNSPCVWFFIVNKLTIYTLHLRARVFAPHRSAQSTFGECRNFRMKSRARLFLVAGKCGVFVAPKIIRTHQSLFARRPIRACDLFNVARNVLFAHMVNIDWWMRRGLRFYFFSPFHPSTSRLLLRYLCVLFISLATNSMIFHSGENGLKVFD